MKHDNGDIALRWPERPPAVLWLAILALALRLLAGIPILAGLLRCGGGMGCGGLVRRIQRLVGIATLGRLLR